MKKGRQNLSSPVRNVSRSASVDEGECGQSMAKTATIARKQPKPKRETNAQRAEREDKRTTTILAARLVAEAVRVIRRIKPESVPACTEEWLKKRSFAFLEQTLCEFCRSGKAPPRFFRLIADFVDGKPPPYCAGKDWYDDKIKTAYQRALNRIVQEKGRYEGGCGQRVIEDLCVIFCGRPSLNSSTFFANKIRICAERQNLRCEGH